MVDTLIRYYATFLQIVGLVVAAATTAAHFGVVAGAYVAAGELVLVGALIERPTKT